LANQGASWLNVRVAWIETFILILPASNCKHQKDGQAIEEQYRRLTGFESFSEGTFKKVPIE